MRPVEQGEGDSFVAAFARPSDALPCALELQLAAANERWPGGIELLLRMGLHTGEVQLRDEYFRTFVTREPVGDAFITKVVERTLAEFGARSHSR